MHEALLYEKLDGERVRCGLCAHRCVIPGDGRGLCGVRLNRGGTLYSEVYGRAAAFQVDPIEKKPLYHFHPGASAFSVGTVGCNFRCRWCQNSGLSVDWRLDHGRPPGRPAAPDRLAAAAREASCKVIAYTYNEPTVFFEYALDTARYAAAAGLKNALVTNGYMTEAMLESFHPLLDAANVDLKSFRDQTYRRFAGARLDPVRQSLRAMKRLGVWVEVTTLIVPGVNDDPAEWRDLARFLRDEIGPETPWHISRFFPMHRQTVTPPTPEKTLRDAAAAGREEGLRHVYLGNLPEALPGDADTHCAACNTLLIRRDGYAVMLNRLSAEGRCPECNNPLAGRGLARA